MLVLREAVPSSIGRFSIVSKTWLAAAVILLLPLANCGGGGGNSQLVATHFSVTAQGNAIAGTAFMITVTALDASNNVVATYSGTVHFTSTDGQAALPANTTLTNGTGKFSVTLITPGPQTITATDTVTASITGTSNSITVIDVATHFSVTAPANATAGIAFNFTVTALDAGNNTVTTYSGTVHFTSTDAQASLPANSMLTNGSGTFSATLMTTGPQTITATDTASASITGTSSSIAVIGQATHFSVTAPASATTGTAFNITVTALDAMNNVASTYSGMVHFTSSDAQADLPINSTLSEGTDMFPVALKTAGSQTITATDTVKASITGTSNSISVAAAGAENPVPLISLPLIPTAVVPGAAAFNLTVNGTGFVPGSVVQWNNSPLTTTFVSKSKLTAAILASDVAAANTAAVTVVNPASGGGTSNVAFFETTAPTSWAGLSPPAEFSAGVGGVSVATGDFNGDGKLDLVVVHNVSTNNVSILLGNGDGTFQPAVSYAVGSTPVSVAVGDFNGDGKLDLVVVDSADATVSILLGNGDGTFQQSFELPAFGSSPASVAVGDFNGDGKLDLAVTNENTGANLGAGTVSVLLGNGDGSFQPALDFAAGPNPGPVVVGDFNGDGKLDLVVANNDVGTNAMNTTISILLGNGDGTFQAAHAFPVGTNPSSLAAADFNGDGKLDLAVANHDTNNVSILLGNGDGTFQSAINLSAGLEPSSVVVADLNGDGKLDLAVANAGTNTVNLLLGNGDGTFQTAVPYATDNRLLSLALGDFNRDGRLDLAAIDGGNAEVLLQPATVSGVNATTSPANLDFKCVFAFGRFCICTNNGGTATLSNFGTSALTIDNIVTTGSFSETNNCGPMLQPGQSCAFNVIWPKTTGAGTLSIQDNATNSPQAVSLNGSNGCPAGQSTVEGQAAQSAACSQK
jgi:hypothetical protein